MAKPASGTALDTGGAFYSRLLNAWAFLENGGTTTADSKSGNTATFAGATAWTTDDNADVALSFPANTPASKLTLASLVTIATSTDFTLIWRGKQTNNDIRGMFCGTASPALFVSMQGGTGIRMQPTSGGEVDFTDVTDFTTEAVYALTSIFASGPGTQTYKFYKNGTLLNTHTGGTGFKIDKIGSGYSSDAFSLIGKMSFLYLLNAELTAGEVSTFNSTPYGIFLAGGGGGQDTPELYGAPFGVRGRRQMHQLLAQ